MASLEPATVCGPRPDGRGLVAVWTAVGWWVWMVVRFVCVIRVIRVPVCLECVPSPPAVSLNRNGPLGTLGRIHNGRGRAGRT